MGHEEKEAENKSKIHEGLATATATVEKRKANQWFRRKNPQCEVNASKLGGVEDWLAV